MKASPPLCASRGSPAHTQSSETASALFSRWGNRFQFFPATIAHFAAGQAVAAAIKTAGAPAPAAPSAGAATLLGAGVLLPDIAYLTAGTSRSSCAAAPGEAELWTRWTQIQTRTPAAAPRGGPPCPAHRSWRPKSPPDQCQQRPTASSSTFATRSCLKWSSVRSLQVEVVYICTSTA